MFERKIIVEKYSASWISGVYQTGNVNLSFPTIVKTGKGISKL